MLRVDASDSVPGRKSVLRVANADAIHSQQVALQAKSHRRLWRNNGLTCFRNIDIKDCLARDLLQGGLGTEGGHKPILQSQRGVEEANRGPVTREMRSRSLPDCCDTILARCEHCNVSQLTRLDALEMRVDVPSWE